MPPLQLLKKIGRLKGSTVLDIGSDSCVLSVPFLENNFTVTVVDIKDAPIELDGRIDFIKSDFDTFTTENKFDIVFARNVLPFLKSDFAESINKILSLTNIGGVCMFTVFGDKDPWASRVDMKVISVLDIDNIIVATNKKVLYKSEELYEGFTMNKELKTWHVITFVVEV